MRVVLASANRGKLRELRALLAPLGVELIAMTELGVDSPEETGTTFLENALLKARHAARRTGLAALGEDSGLEVDALRGAPGVYSARFAGAEASDAANLGKLLAELHDVPAECRQARYRCVMALVRSAEDPEPVIAQGSWEGQIATLPRGSGGFGYDPIFVPAGSERTAAELSPAEKNERSHRAQASRALLAELEHQAPWSSLEREVRKGRLFVISAPSGAGKTSLVRALIERHPKLHVSISHTTRSRRPTEEHGREYYFVSVPEFAKLIEQGEFLEHARVFDNLYGTARSPVTRKLAAGSSVILEIDWQGARQVRAALPECVSIFVLPPSRAALEARLRNRGTDSEQVVARRLRDAAADMAHCREFDYVVINDRFEQALSDLGRVIEGDPGDLRSSRASLEPLLASLLA